VSPFHGAKWSRVLLVVTCVHLLLCVPRIARGQQQRGSVPPPKVAAPAPRQTAPHIRQDLATPAGEIARQPVIAVLHRLRGWRLRALLTPPPGASFPAAFDDNFVRTNIVAGYLLPDGRTVVARLPSAEAEMLNFSSDFRRAGMLFDGKESSLTFVREDGVEFKAEFVGLDGSTGLSLLEAAEPLMPVRDKVVDAATVVSSVGVGQRVRLIAPASAEAMRQPAPPAAAAIGDQSPTGDTGVVFMQMRESLGRLREVRRSPSGRTTGFTIEADSIEPDLNGGVALSETGTLVGIIEQGSGGREMRVLPAEMVRGAASRVKARRASVPQPWLGVRGDAVARTPLKFFTVRGWSPEAARQVSNRQSGVLLTAVAPGTPAAVAGLRPGDVVARISELEVRGIEDMTLLIKELGGNSVADFTVFRAGSAPLKLPVRLSESLNPVQDTVRAEALAARLEVRARADEARHSEITSREAVTEEKQTVIRVRLARAEVERANQARQPSARALLAKEQQRLASARQRVEHERLRLQVLRAQLAEARSRLLEAEARLTPFMSARLSLPVKALLPFGIEARPMAGTGMNRPGARAGLIIISVRPDSSAAGLRVGDVIETLNDQPLSLSELQHDALSDASGITLGVRREQQQLTIKLLRQSSQ